MRMPKSAEATQLFHKLIDTLTEEEWKFDECPFCNMKYDDEVEALPHTPTCPFYMAEQLADYLEGNNG